MPNEHQKTIEALYTVSKEKILETIHLTAKDRLQWLAEMNEFRMLAVPKEKRDAWDEYMRRYNVPG